MVAPRLLRARLAGSVMILGVSVACSSDRVPSSTTVLHAAAAAACGPTDGPAVAIYLARAPIESLEPPAPYARVYVWQPLERLAGRSWSLAPNEGEGGAWFHPTATDFEVATRGTVRVTAIRPDSTVEGWADLTFPSAGRISGTFRAPWHRRQVLCG